MPSKPKLPGPPGGGVPLGGVSLPAARYEDKGLHADRHLPSDTDPTLPIMLGHTIVGSSGGGGTWGIDGNANAWGYWNVGNTLLSVSAQKKFTNSNLLVHYGMSYYTTFAATVVQQAVWRETGGASGSTGAHNILNKWHNEITSHKEHNGSALLIDIGVGLSVLRIVLKPGAGSQANGDANDSGWITVWEVPKQVGT